MRNASDWLTAAPMVAILAAGPSACVERPTAAQCRAMADHMVALHQRAQEGRGAELAAEVAGERHAALQATCEADGTLTEVQCVLATAELAELSRCAPQ